MHAFGLTGCKAGGSWIRPGGDVGTAAGGFAGSFQACNDICKGGGYTHFGLECPMASATHCQCATSVTSSSANPVWDAGAFGTKGAGPSCANILAHCNNAATLTHEGFIYEMGGASVGSVYLVS